MVELLLENYIEKLESRTARPGLNGLIYVKTILPLQQISRTTKKMIDQMPLRQILAQKTLSNDTVESVVDQRKWTEPYRGRMIKTALTVIMFKRKADKKSRSNADRNEACVRARNDE